MRVLLFPNDKSKAGNPYCNLLYGNMEKLGAGVVSIEPFTPMRALLGRYDVFHLHWPEYYLSASALKALAGTLGLLFFVAWLRFRGTRIVWTAHNLRSHNRRYPKAESWFWRMLTPMFDGYITLSESSARLVRAEFPALGSTPASVILHGDYRGSYPVTITGSDARLRLGIPADQSVVLFFGGINPYKNVPHLIETFLHADLPRSTLVIAGNPSSQEDERQAAAATQSSDRVQLHLQRIPADDVQVFFKAADLVVLPFLEILNSGSAILALSFDRPVLVPDAGSLPELQAQVGAEWVRTYHGQLSVGDLQSAIAWSRNEKRAPQTNLTAFAWPLIARDTLSMYEHLVAADFPKKSPSTCDTGPV
jgi:beta-1,4-mannosyltransferase